MKYRIIEQIESKGLSVTEFVEKMGWKQRSSFYNIVNGNPTIPVLERMASILECRVSDLLDEGDSEYSSEQPKPKGFHCPKCGAELELKLKE